MPPSDSSIDDAIAPLLAALDAPGSNAVVVAPPGSGKTTRLPLALLRCDWLERRRIVVLEPRRLAARAAARRMSDLIGDTVGGTIGFTTRDERSVGPSTRIEVITEGILTRRLQHDPDLPGVALVIFDEIHERNLQTDIALAFALDSRRALRPDLRIAAMSATVAADRFAALLGDEHAPAPIIVGGSTPHPVDVRWFPRRPDDRLEPRMAEVIATALRRDDGDLLAFLPGAREIIRTGELLADSVTGVDVLPLYGALGSAEQDAALQPSAPGRRRVVLATDIAESSLTVDGVRIVVDSGLARAPRFDARSGMTRLELVSISKASADQRAGRAGRQGPGVVYRLWSKGEHAARRAYTEPEIALVDLAGFALELAAWGTHDPAQLPLLDQPPDARFIEARRLLTQLGALDEDGRLTPRGSALAAFPLHPRLAAMVQARVDERSPRRTALACVIAALIDERDVLRGRPDEIPADLETRLSLLADRDRRHGAADGRAIATVRRRAGELIARTPMASGTSVEAAARPADPAEPGELLAAAYPDRLAVQRSQAGRFQLASGTAAWVRATDPLAAEPFVIAVDLDGTRREARIRLGAPIDARSISHAFGTPVTEASRLAWDDRRNELVEHVERRLAGAVLDSVSRKPEPGPFVVDALLERVRQRGVDNMLRWSPSAESLRSRATFLHRTVGAPWPDWSWETLANTLDDWLAPFLMFARSRADLEAVDPSDALRATIDHRTLSRLDDLAPSSFTGPTGRRFAIDYEPAGDDAGPVLAVRVQELFGVTVHPTIGAGRVPLVLHLLSPAGRPIQITSDLPGFWAGSWADARKDMAGRYPKHSWPADPARAKPPQR